MHFAPTPDRVIGDFIQRLAEPLWQNSLATWPLAIGVPNAIGTQLFWHTYLTRGAGLIVSGQGTTKDLHKDTFDALQLDIRKMPWPYFIPSGKEIARLPIVSAL